MYPQRNESNVTEKPTQLFLLAKGAFGNEETELLLGKFQENVESEGVEVSYATKSAACIRKLPIGNQKSPKKKMNSVRYEKKPVQTQKPKSFAQVVGKCNIIPNT